MKKLNTIKLGGWHRLWILLSFLYLIIVISFTVDEFPKSLTDIDGPYRVLEYMNQDNAQHILTISKPWQSSVKDENSIKTRSGWFLNISIPSNIASNGISKGSDGKEKISSSNIGKSALRYSDVEGALTSEQVNKLKTAGFSDEDIKGYVDRKMSASSKEPVSEERQQAAYLLKQRISADFDRKMPKLLQRQQMTAIGTGILAWMIPVAVLYFFGWSVGWVYRGFQKEAK